MFLKIIVNYCFYVKSTEFCYQRGLNNFQRFRNACNKTRKMCCRFKKNITYQISYNSLFLSLFFSLSLFLSLANHAKQEQTFLRNFARTSNVVNRRRKWHFAKGKPEVWLPRGRMSRKWDSRWFHSDAMSNADWNCIQKIEVLFIVK